VMPSLASAKRRFSRRRHQTGAVMFIVAMTIAVLASVGMYALAAASNELRTSGNERQNTQTHYLAQYAMIAATHELVSFRADLVAGAMFASPEPTCLALPGVPATANAITRACRRWGSVYLSQSWASPATVPYTGNTPYAPGANPGSFGMTTLTGDFFVELTDLTYIDPPPGYERNGQVCSVEFTITSTGITSPYYPTQLGGGALAQLRGQGFEVQRGRVIAAPVPHCGAKGP
jgi:hypothetical protein